MGGAHQETVIEALNKAAPFYRSELGRQLAIRFTPSLRFYIDETFDEASKITALLQSNRVKQDL
jgi:ribosome-binding factor A